MLLNGFNRVVNYDSLSANFRKLESLLKQSRSMKRKPSGLGLFCLAFRSRMAYQRQHARKPRKRTYFTKLVWGPPLTLSKKAMQGLLLKRLQLC